MHPNTEKLHQLMERHKVDAAEVADMLGRRVNTIRVWRVSDTERPIPDDTLRLLEALLQQRVAAQKAKKAAAAAKKRKASSGKARG